MGVGGGGGGVGRDVERMDIRPKKGAPCSAELSAGMFLHLKLELLKQIPASNVEKNDKKYVKK